MTTKITKSCKKLFKFDYPIKANEGTVNTEFHLIIQEIKLILDKTNESQIQVYGVT